jgi:class 3 adenylate cyclase
MPIMTCLLVDWEASVFRRAQGSFKKESDSRDMSERADNDDPPGDGHSAPVLTEFDRTQPGGGQMKDGASRRAGKAELELRLLGPLEASKAGKTISVGGPKPRALLAVLVLDLGRVVSVDRLVEELWPGDPPETAAHAVQVYVSQLRKALGTEALARRGPGYALEIDPERVDVARFTKLVTDGREALALDDAGNAAALLRDALALWRGPAFADFAYEPFAQTEISRLEELRTVALEERIEADLALGRHAELVSELEALVEVHPLRERPRAQLMLALYRSGRQADALSEYRRAREGMIDELGIEPGPELKALESAILRQDESLTLVEEVAARPAMQFRRLVTILFADVVESMALAETLDPEALGTVLRDYFETVSAVLARHGGTVEKFAGDAVMAAFGVPVTHEDDPLRAARAAVEIQVALAALNERLERDHGVRLDARIGIETGEVVAAQTDTRQRLVTGEAVGIAARLEQSAEAGQILVGELTGRLIDHVARLEPLGELEIKGKREPVHAYRLLEIAPVSPAFEQRLDAPLAGRRKELAALRKALRAAKSEQRARAVTVIGSPGIGKSRLAAELASRTKDVTALFGRCLSYGEGITYWPLREVVQAGPETDERDAVLAALDADTPPPAPEIALLFRRFCEALARERPLVLVLDDVHWAEPTFLELVEHLADKGDGPIVALCVAREELLEHQPEFLAGRANAERVVLDALSNEETETLLEGLGGEILETDQRARVAEAAEGNPLFLEQLFALAAEGGLAERALPETIQALLAARLDRLGPGERAVLERGAVVGKEFGAGDVTALLDPHAAPTADAHLRTLAVRGFVRPAGDAFRFRHVLVQEAVYRAAPKRLRAELHERFADHLERSAPDLVELDEFAGYHLEQAYRLRTELGESDRHAATLAQDAGTRLGAAGIRACKRGDMPASVGLLTRATSLLPVEEALQRELLCELAIALRAIGDTGASESVLVRAIGESKSTGDRRIELRACVEYEYIRPPGAHPATREALLEVVAEGIPIFEATRDDRALGRAWLLFGFVKGARRGDHRSREEAATRALTHYRASSWPISTCLGEIASSLYNGPTPAPQAIARCEQLLQDEELDRAGRANLEVYLGGLSAQLGDFEEARSLVASGRQAYEDLGQRTAVALHADAVQAEVEMLAGDLVVAERILRGVCMELERTEAYPNLASAAGLFAEVLLSQGHVDEAAEWARIAEAHSALDDLDAQLIWMPVSAKLAARHEEFEKAESVVRDAATRSRESDALNRCAQVHRALGEVLLLANRVEEAAEAFDRAVELYERKGNIVGAGRARELRDELVLA